ncbi:GNAT family N-acetyltransferase [Kineosporia sp. A_224]|uniref:GNAT family N-acetyltransferase n=1 Tax=Kineosporia sp. A_224 TaxID=1962180 RepID=UPI00350EE994
MEVHELTVVDDTTREECWAVYERAFGPLRARAVQRHLMHRHEFDEVLSDPRVDKYVAVDGSRVVAMATLTNDLSAVPLISPEYFQTRWPEHYAAGHVWYVGFLGIDPDYRRTSVSALLIRALGARAAVTGGVVGVDICDFNEETLRLARSIRTLGRVVSAESVLHRLDAQTFWAYEVPQPSGQGLAVPVEPAAARTVMVLPAETLHLDAKSEALTAGPQSQP